MRTTRIAAVLAVASLAAFTAACGDDENASDTTPAPAAETTTTEAMAADKDIVATASATDDLSTLVSAVQAADLVETLQEPGPYTVFAPTNEAFDALGADTLETLTTTDKGKEDLKGILLNHVVAGDVKAADLSDGQEVETVGGAKLTVKIDGDKVMIGDATVTAADVETSNGTVHIIDAVLQ
jgi:uncharacterized surface protein with fasciclin (FAS1) repeats